MPHQRVKAAFSHLQGSRTNSVDEYLRIQFASRAFIPSLALDVVPDHVRTVGDYLCTDSSLNLIIAKITAKVSDFHRRFPFATGIATESLSKQLRLPQRLIEILPIPADAGLEWKDGCLRQVLHRPPSDSPFLRSLMTAMNQAAEGVVAFSQLPPLTKDDKASLQTLARAGSIIRLDQNTVMSAKAFAVWQERIESYLQQQGEANVVTMRDAFGVGRKFLVLVLDTLVRKKITTFDGLNHRLTRSSTRAPVAETRCHPPPA
jgi:hypothetical protein